MSTKSSEQPLEVQIRNSRSNLIEIENKYLNLLKQKTLEIRISNQYKLKILDKQNGRETLSQIKKLYKLQRRKDIKALKFDSRFYSEKDIKSLYGNLSIGSKYLEEINFQRFSCSDYSLTMMLGLANVLRIGFPKLKKFYGEFNDVAFDNEYSIIIFDSFRHGYESLENFILDGSSLDCTLTKYLSEKVLPKMNKLTSFRLQCCILEEGAAQSMKNLSQALANQYLKLEKLKLDLDMLEISSTDIIGKEPYNEAFEKLLEGLKTQGTSLTHLCLCLNFFRLTDDDHMTDFCKCLEDMTKLKSLKLSFTGSEISDNGFRNLLNTIAPKIKNLELLHLGFSYCDDISSNSMKVLADVLSEGSNKLEDLNLVFNNNRKISDEGIKSLIKGLSAPFPNLQRISLRIQSCGKVETETIVDLRENLYNKYTNIKNLFMKTDGKVIDSVKDLHSTLEEAKKNLAI